MGISKIIYIKDGTSKIVCNSDPTPKLCFFKSHFWNILRNGKLLNGSHPVISIYLIQSNYILHFVFFCQSFTVKLKVNSLVGILFFKECSYLTLPFSSFHFPTDILVQPQISSLSKIPRTSLELSTASPIPPVTSIFSVVLKETDVTLLEVIFLKESNCYYIKA